MYSAVILDEASKEKLLRICKSNIPSGWKVYCHHMTIKMGELSDKSEIGKPVVLSIEKIGKSDTAMAVGVSGYPTTNKIPHITIAVNVGGGGKPVDSNKIEHWKNLPVNIKLTGTVQEIG